MSKMRMEVASLGKKEFVKSMAEKTGLSQGVTEQALNAFIEVLEEAVEEKKKVQFVGYFSVEVKERKERNGRNPATGEAIVIPASNQVVFKVGQKLKDAAN